MKGDGKLASLLTHDQLNIVRSIYLLLVYRLLGHSFVMGGVLMASVASAALAKLPSQQLQYSRILVLTHFPSIRSTIPASKSPQACFRVPQCH